MKQDKPIYCIKSLHGQKEIEGDFAAIVGWLREKRINSDDDLRRLGFTAFEKDELWARVKDFPEFNLSDREGRQALIKAGRQANLFKWVGIAALVVGCGLIAWNQAWPRYVESVKVADSQQMAEDAKADAARRIKDAITAADKVKALAAAETKEAALIKDASAKAEAQARRDLLEMKDRLAVAVSERNQAIKEMQAAEYEKAAALASIKDQIRSQTENLNQSLSAERASSKKLSDELTELRQTLPLLCKFEARYALIGKDWFGFSYLNTSRETIHLRFKITRPDGSVLEKSFKALPAEWTKLDVDGHEFRGGDTVAIVPTGLDSGKYKAVAYICPSDPK